MADVFFRGDIGRIEGKYHPNESKNAPLALILHPHPLHGGNMNSKVVYQLNKAFVESGFTTLRINFRGVGKSEGKFDGETGELLDAAYSLAWLRDQNQSSDSIWIAGFSFGALIAAQLAMRRPEIHGMIMVAPPITPEKDLDFLSPCPIPALLIHGDQDSVIKEDYVRAFAQKTTKQKKSNLEYKVIKEADHFFRKHLDELHKEVKDYILDHTISESQNNQKQLFLK